MQEKNSFCLQCQKPSAAPSNRLVQDSCGHKKCRSCLLEDEEKCKQCLGTVVNINDNYEETDIEPRVKDNRTAVIQCNGKALLNCDKMVEDVLDKTLSNTNDCKIEAVTSILKGVVSESVIKRESRELKKAKNVGKKKIMSIPAHIMLKSDPVCYLCKICKKTFFTKSHIKYHQYCAGELKPYRCEVCGRDFILKVQLQIHMFKHGEIKPFTCSVCKKSFSEKSKLSRHMILHSVEKKHVCTECGKAFKSRESLRIHSIIHKNEKPFACKLCSAKFNNSSNLNKHMASHSSEKVHMCDQCGRRFKLKWALSVHRKSHLRVRPHICNLCPKAFVNLKDLQRHNLVHIESKGYMCSICSTSFRRKDNLRRHMKNTHPGKKGEVVKNHVKAPEITKNPVVLDNPNAINVITASPAITKSKAEPMTATQLQQPTAKSTDSRPAGTSINGPIKLAVKSPAFKSHYNIARHCDYVPSAQITKPFVLTESVDIYQKILSPKGESHPPRTIRGTDGPASSEICSIPNVDETALKPSFQQNLVSYSSALHYETSFQYGKHAMIKNIKFKVPEQYTNQCKQNNNNNNNNSNSLTVNSEDKVYSQLNPVASASVIVTNSNHIAKSCS